MPDLYVLMNHKLTESQQDDARVTLGVERIMELPEHHKEVWEQLPPEQPQLLPLLEPIFRWIDERAAEGDFVLVQGDFGACYLSVTHAFRRGLIPVYSTTRRVATEEHARDGSVEMKHRFRHVMFRRYNL